MFGLYSYTRINIYCLYVSLPFSPSHYVSSLAHSRKKNGSSLALIRLLSIPRASSPCEWQWFKSGMKILTSWFLSSDILLCFQHFQVPTTLSPRLMLWENDLTRIGIQNCPPICGFLSVCRIRWWITQRAFQYRTDWTSERSLWKGWKNISAREAEKTPSPWTPGR